MVTFQGSKQFGFRDLYEWRDNEWRKIDHLEFDEKTKFECGDRAHMKRAVDASGNVYFVVERGFGLKIYRFQLSDDGKKGTINLQHDIMTAFPDRTTGGHLVRTAISGHHLYALYGEQGCGFRWAPTHPFRVDLNNGSVEHLVVGSETGEGGKTCPPWSFSGAYADYLAPPKQWFFFGGCRAKGLSSSEDDPSIWIMDLEAKEWHRFEASDMPPGARFSGTFGGKFYLTNIAEGVYELIPGVI